MSGRDLAYLSVVDQVAAVAGGEVTARELVEHSLARITRLNPVLNAFAYVRDEDARREADQLDVARARGDELGPLHGVPIAIKQENDVAGLPTEFGGAANTTPAAADSEVVRLLRAAGAIIVGTTRMPEFGIWPFTESSAHGWTRNPWDISRSPAGSSGGTAVAVASGMVAAGIGGDGGGSIRLPSSWCGLFGMKAQRGRVSAAPHSDLWRALGTIGPLTRTVADSALIYDVISGTTGADRFHADALPGSMLAAARATPAALRIMVSMKNPMGGPAPDDLTRAAVHEAAAVLRSLGHTVIEADPRYPSLGLAFQTQVAGGVADEASRVEHPELLEARTRTLLRTTAPLRRWGARAERSAQRAADAFLPALFADVDVLLTPTTPTPALPVGQLDGVGGIAASRKATPVASYTSAWNVLGNPAAAVPAGFTPDGLPLSVQLIGPSGGELTLLSLAAQFERARAWADRRPPIAER